MNSLNPNGRKVGALLDLKTANQHIQSGLNIKDQGQIGCTD